jgi:hypothetical protein
MKYDKDFRGNGGNLIKPQNTVAAINGKRFGIPLGYARNSILERYLTPTCSVSPSNNNKASLVAAKKKIEQKDERIC